jgi:hypothetical protein
MLGTTEWLHKLWPLQWYSAPQSWLLKHDKINLYISSGFETTATNEWNVHLFQTSRARLCVLVVRVPAYRSRGPRFGSRWYKIVCVAVDLERGTLSLVRKIEEILWRKNSGSGLENRDQWSWVPVTWPLNFISKFMETFKICLQESFA